MADEQWLPSGSDMADRLGDEEADDLTDEELDAEAEAEDPTPMAHGKACPDCGAPMTQPEEDVYLCTGCGTRWQDFGACEDAPGRHVHEYAGREGGYRCACGVVRRDRDDVAPGSRRRS